MFKFYDCEDLVSDSADIDRWILHLTGRCIKELVLEHCIEEPYKIPWCLFSCQSLQHLKLEWCELKPPTTFEGFKNLKSIDQNSVMVAHDVFENLISGCPQLEELKLIEVERLDQINIHVPNLKLFEIIGEFEGISFDNTFQLTTMVIDLWLDLNSESNQHKPHGRSSNLLKFFDHQPHIQSLEIRSSFLKTRRFVGDTLTPPTYCWEDMFSGPVMPFRLRHVSIDGIGISGTKLELDFIKYVLLYSPVLEKMTVVPFSKVKPELMMKALLRFKRASVEAEVII